MRTARGQRTLHTARCILAEHKGGKQTPEFTLMWAQAIVNANAPAEATGWVTPLLQDSSRELSRWLSTRIDALEGLRASLKAINEEHATRARAFEQQGEKAA